VNACEYAAEESAMYAVEVEQEDDGRWIAEVPELPGVLAYGKTREEAVRRAQALSLRVLAERLENGEPLPQVENVFSIVA
jgi:predicted RNase H-like HicB family nuclease